MSKLSSLVKTLCKVSGLKMKDVAERIGITPITLSQNLAKDNPRTQTWINLAEAFNMDVDDLMELYAHPDEYTITKNGVEGGRLAIRHRGGISERQLPHGDSNVEAIFSFMGIILYAYSLQDAKDIVNIMDSLSQMAKEGHSEAFNSTLHLLIKQYGTKKED